MMRRSVTEMVQVSLRVPRGADALWAKILKLDKSGPWTTVMIAPDCKNARASARDFVRRLLAAERPYAEETGTADANGSRFFRLLRHPIDAPRLRRDGTPSNTGLGQEQMWESMGYLHSFTAAQLRIHASTDEVKVALETAKSYCVALAAAGILRIVDKGGAAKEAVYALPPDQNRGPRAPMILKSKCVFDPNLNEIVGPAQDVREVLA